MSEPTTQGNGDAGQTLAPVSLLGAWVEAKEKLPPFLTPVLVMNTERHMAFEPFGCWKGVGVLNGQEMWQPYWSMMGSDGALCLDAVTHWLLIPEAPNAGTER